MDTDDLMDLMKTQQDVYLAAYEQGYRKGWNDALDKALKLINQPKRRHRKPENSNANV
jgi:hypothetical protein